MSSKITVYRGDTFSGSVNLRTIDPVDHTKTNTYVIPTGATIEMRFAGTVTPVSITSAASEVTIANASLGHVTFTMAKTKSPGLALGTSQGVDLIITELSGAVTTFEKLKILNVLDRMNG